MLKAMLEIWKKVLTKPQETFRAQAKKADYAEAVKHVGLAGIVQGILYGLFLTLVGSTIGSALGGGYAFFGTSLGLLSIVGFAILIPIFAIIWLFIGSGIFYIVARILGGNGSYQTQTYLIAIYSAPMAIFSAFAAIPYVGMLIWLAVTVYTLYLLTLAMKETHKFTTGKAVLTWLIPMLVVLALALVLLGAILAAVGISGLSALG